MSDKTTLEDELAQFAGFHSVDIKELHGVNCPALFEYAQRMARFGRD